MVEHRPRKGRDIRTGERIEIPAKKAIKFNAAREMKDAINALAKV